MFRYASFPKWYSQMDPVSWDFPFTNHPRCGAETSQEKTVDGLGLNLREERLGRVGRGQETNANNHPFISL